MPRLTEEQRKEIYELDLSGELSKQQLAEMFGVSYSTILNVCKTFLGRKQRKEERALNNDEIRKKQTPIPPNFLQPANEDPSCSGPIIPDSFKEEYVYVVCNKSMRKMVAFFHSEEKAHVICRALNAALEEHAGDGIAKFTYTVFPVICWD